jgi:HEAT repeat protein
MADGRRAASLAGYQGDEDVARRALGDQVAAVRASGLGALARMGRLRIADIEAALQDPSGVVRRRACELTVNLADPGGQLLGALVIALDDPDPWVVESACYALGESGPGANPGSAGETSPAGQTSPAGNPRPGGDAVVPRLAAAATSHPDPLCREAAVAALGALGDRRGLPAILKATTDKTAIRRRAVLALAAFDGPDVETALTRAEQDRDWQVRQAAEDLRLR